jgi:N5-(carboxyethyl)ornithine synthase
MKTIGFVISRKENERRRALIPPDLKAIRHVGCLYFESGYGEILGYSDDEYIKMGANVVDWETLYQQDIICNPKAPEPEERMLFKEGQTLFGWIHAVQGRAITDFLIEKKMTAIAWEEMFENGRHVFWRNNELAGEAAVLHAFMYFGRPAYECDVAVLGRGNCARGAIRVLEKLGAKIMVYDKKTITHFRNELDKYDVIVNAVLWDVFRSDRLIYREELQRMKRGAMIIDISCDEGLEIETSRPTTIENPIYIVDGIIHYVVDHTASLFWKSASEAISREVKKYIDDLVEDKLNPVLEAAKIIERGKILDEKIVRFQRR